MGEGVKGAAAPPPGSVPDFDNPTDVYYTAAVANHCLCIALMTLFFGVRVYVKVVIKRGEHYLEDWFCGFAWAITVLLGVCFLMLTRYGGGYHVWEVPEDEFSMFLMWLYAATVVYTPAAFATKVVLILMIARVFAVRQRVSWALKALCVLIALTYIPLQAFKIAVCKPISSYWDEPVHVAFNDANPNCSNQSKLFIVDMTVAIVADTLILIMPIPLTLTMRLPCRVQLKIIFMLSIGGTALGTVVYRFKRTLDSIPSADLTVDFMVLSMLGLYEPTIGVICACLPSANILLETLTAPTTDPNVARTGSFLRRVCGKVGTLTSSAISSIDFWSKLGPSTRASTVTTRARTQNNTTNVDKGMQTVQLSDIERYDQGATEHSEDRLPPLTLSNVELWLGGGSAGGKGAHNAPTNLDIAGIRGVDEASDRTAPSRDMTPSTQVRDEMEWTTQSSDSQGNRGLALARSWDGVVSEGAENGQAIDFDPMESLNTQTAVRIKWLSSASR